MPPDVLVRVLLARLLSSGWPWELSGCYRRRFYNNTRNGSTENHVITELDPVMIMISDKAYDQTNPRYDAG